MGIGLRAQAEPAARGALGLPANAANSLYDTVWPYGIRAIAVSQSQTLVVLPSGANGKSKSRRFPARYCSICIFVSRETLSIWSSSFYGDCSADDCSQSSLISDVPSLTGRIHPNDVLKAV